MKRLAIVSTHPIQYNAPLFRILAESGHMDIRVFYTWEQTKKGPKFDPGFGQTVAWDIPLLEGYDFTFVRNRSVSPGSHHFWGIHTPSLNREIEAWQADAVLVYGWSFAGHLACMRYFKGKLPVFFRGDSNNLDQSNYTWIRTRFRNAFLRQIYNYVDYALYVGQANQVYYLQNGLNKTQLVFAPHCIDNRRFADANGNYEKQALEWKEKLGIDPAATVFLFAGKFEPKKDPLLLLETFQKISKDNVHLIFVGNGPLASKILHGSLRNNNVHKLDFQNQLTMPIVYRLSDVLVLPSRGPGETWGLAVNEAMACSRAVLVSNRCGCNLDLVIPGRNGARFMAGNFSDLEEKMTELIELGKPKLKEMGRQSAAIIQNWSYEACQYALISCMRSSS